MKRQMKLLYIIMLNGGPFNTKYSYDTHIQQKKVYNFARKLGYQQPAAVSIQMSNLLSRRKIVESRKQKIIKYLSKFKKKT